MKTTILSKLIGKKRQKKQEKKRIFNLNDAKVEDHYSMGEVLGKGSFAKVKMGMHYKSSKKVAIKIIEKNNIEVKIESLKTEVKILMNVKHPNIVSLLDVFEDDDKLYLIMELMTGGELFDKICNDYPNGYSEKQAADLTRQIIEAVKYLHGKGIIHRDLKPENLLFSHPDDDSAQIKISDFGLAKIWSGDTLARTACGSPNYVAPEVCWSLWFNRSAPVPPHAHRSCSTKCAATPLRSTCGPSVSSSTSYSVASAPSSTRTLLRSSGPSPPANIRSRTRTGSR